MGGIFLLLGSNLGNPKDNLIEAHALIQQRIGTVVKASSIYKTEPWGAEDQSWFLNQALEIETELPPLDLLERIHQLEAQMGRVRSQKWQERKIDIDILYYRDRVVEEEALKIPHPQILFRRFTLVPLAEIAPEKLHPVELKTQSLLLHECLDPLGVEPFTSATIG